MTGFLGTSRSPHPSSEPYEILSSSDTDEIPRRSSNLTTVAHHRAWSDGDVGHARSSSDSSAPATPSRVSSPTPPYSLHPLHRLSTSISEGDDGPVSPLLMDASRYSVSQDGGRNWLNLRSTPRRRRKRERRIWRSLKKGARRLIRHPLFPHQPLTIVRKLSLVSFMILVHKHLAFRPPSLHSLCHLPYSVAHVYTKPRQGAPTLASILLDPGYLYSSSFFPPDTFIPLY